jgi:signal peptidase I
MRSEAISSKAPFSKAKAETLSIPQQVAQITLVCVLASGFYLLLSHYVLQAVKVQGVSMVPTLHNADSYLLKRWVYYVRSPQRGDIVVIKDPTDGTLAVKRIVALASETVYMDKRGHLFVNDKELSEPYLEQGTRTFAAGDVREQMIGISQGQFFILGDNRNNSFDSRYYGPIPKQNILGVITP